MITTDIKKDGNIAFEIDTMEKECVLSASFSFHNVLQVILYLLPLTSNQKTMIEGDKLKDKNGDLGNATTNKITALCFSYLLLTNTNI